MIGGGYLIYINQDDIITYYVVRQVAHVVDHYIVSNITTDYGTVVQTHRSAQIVKFELIRFQNSDAYQSKELALVNKIGHKLICDFNKMPVIRCVPVFFQFFYFVSFQMAIYMCG